ncbi:MAG: ribonuclease H-like domain-containing protein [Spirochaetota bacterium]
MLERTFLHVRLVGEKREQYLWENGIRSWRDFSPSSENLDLPPKVLASLVSGLAESEKRLLSRDWDYFARALRHKHLYRMYPYLADRTLFLDIETTGVRSLRNAVTIIGCYDGVSPRVFVQGRDLDEFPAYIKRFSLVVTFNGKEFDIPFLERALHMRIDTPHIDLRRELAALGVLGGLKKIERELGIERQSQVAELNGYAAVVLWERYRKRNDTAALDTLIHYNIADTVSLERLLHVVYNKRMESYGFPDRVAEKPIPVVTHPYSPEVIAEIMPRVERVTGKKRPVIDTPPTNENAPA